MRSPQIDIEHGANRDKGAKANIFAETPVQDRGTERATLADKADIAGSRHAFGKGSVEPGDGTHDAQTVGADDAHLGAAGAPQDFFLKLRAGFADFFEACGDNDCAFDACLDTFFNDPRY